MKKILRYIIATITLLIMSAVICSCGPGIMDFYIFSDIDECNNIEAFKSEDATITIYDSPDLDKNLGDLAYNDFFAAYYDSNELKFEIFAYEFVDSDSAKKYFERETGIETDISTRFLASGGIKTYNVIVIDDCNAYCANTSQKDSEDLKLFLGEIFSKKIEL